MRAGDQQQQEKQPSINRSSPFYRYDTQDLDGLESSDRAGKKREVSPLLATDEERPLLLAQRAAKSLYHTQQEKILAPGSVPRKNILASLFKGDQSQDFFHAKQERRVAKSEIASSGHQNPFNLNAIVNVQAHSVPPVSSSHDSSSPSRDHHYAARKVAGKRTVLTKLETADSFFIWTMLLLPLLSTALVYHLHRPFRYDSWHHNSIAPYCVPATSIYNTSANCTFTNNSWKFRSKPLSPLNGFMRSYFTLVTPISNIGMNQQNLALAVQPTLHLYGGHGHSREFTLPEMQFYPFYLASILTDGNNVKNLKFPLPYIDIEHTVGRSEYSDWEVSYNFTLLHSNISSLLEYNLYSQTFSADFILITSCETIVYLLLSIIFLIYFTKKVIRHARTAYENVSVELPYIYQADLSVWHFVLPEQYACIAALVALCFSSNVYRLFAIYRYYYCSGDDALATWLDYWQSTAVGFSNYGTLSCRY